ncbi:competence protein ComK [Ureibacillus sinduriensis]|uniref:Uncharacterized protein n=1 Tax=Ureibacillus sinduriensis BLB-1 = JCM 15800 TaxID=1384057 RepID=A0A0A3HXQ1_9BACL|nr:competence protein ComK [Ureibacillus sinduriensis]KGR76005.1 hypothetical protein CD33_09215 [Ureibacillus sinduriensis BLB-1 = JCM 15800]
MKIEEKYFKEYHSLAVVPHYDGEHASVIHTLQGNFYSKYTTNANLDNYCLLFGSSLEGRKQAARQRFNDVKNPSILISEALRIAGFQVPHLDRLDPMWIVDLDVTIEALSKTETLIIFRNGLQLMTPLAENSVKNRRFNAISRIHECSPLLNRNLHDLLHY